MKDAFDRVSIFLSYSSLSGARHPRPRPSLKESRCPSQWGEIILLAAERVPECPRIIWSHSGLLVHKRQRILRCHQQPITNYNVRESPPTPPRSKLDKSRVKISTKYFVASLITKGRPSFTLLLLLQCGYGRLFPLAFTVDRNHSNGFWQVIFLTNTCCSQRQPSFHFKPCDLQLDDVSEHFL